MQTRRYSMKTGALKQTEIVYLNGIRMITEERERGSDFASVNEKLFSGKQSQFKEQNASQLESLSQVSKIALNPFEKRNSLSQFDPSLVKEKTPEGSDLTHFELKLDQRKKLMQRGSLTSESLKNIGGTGKLNVTAPLVTDKMSDLSHKFHHSFFDLRKLSEMKSKFGPVEFGAKSGKIEQGSVSDTRIYFPGQNFFIQSTKKVKNLIHMKVIRGEVQSFNDLENYLKFPVKLNLACGGVPQISVNCLEIDSQTESKTKADSEWAKIQENKQRLCYFILEKSYLKKQFEENTFYLKFFSKIKKKTSTFQKSLKLMLHLQNNQKQEILKILGLGFGQIKKKSFLKKPFTNCSMVLSSQKRTPRKEGNQNLNQSGGGVESDKKGVEIGSERELGEVENEVCVFSKNEEIEPGFILEYLQQIGKSNFHLKRENELLRDKLKLFNSKM